MNRPLAIVDYGMGNLRSVQKGFERVGCEASVTREHQVILEAAGVVLPGVGSFRRCMDNLKEYGLVDVLQRVLAASTPFLGICLGYQLLFTESEEFGLTPGLGVLPGRVVRFPRSVKVPHMGWNIVRKEGECLLLDGIPDGTYFYFVHSYFVLPEDPTLVAATTEYGGPFASMIARGNLFATQFHPEKSQKAGLALLRAFGRVCAGD